MKYVLAVDLKIKDEVKRVSLSSGTLEGLLKYTSYCVDEGELIKFLPHDDDFSVRTYIEKHLNKKNDSNYSPFSIRKQANLNSRKVDVLYKKDLDVLLVNKADLLKLIRDNYSLSINDISSGNIPSKIDVFLKKIYDKFKSYNLIKAKDLLIEKKLDPDKEYDSRFEILKSKPYLSLAINNYCLEIFVCSVIKDDKKKIEFAKMLKEDLNKKLLVLSNEEFKERMTKINNKAFLNGCSLIQIRNNMRRNIKLVKEVNDVKDNKKSDIKPYIVTDKEIIKYNEKRNNSRNDCLSLELLEKIDDLERRLKMLYEERKIEENKLTRISFLETEKDIENKIKCINEEISNLKVKLASLKYDFDSLETGNYTYSDAGFIVDKRI